MIFLGGDEAHRVRAWMLVPGDLVSNPGCHLLCVLGQVS